MDKETQIERQKFQMQKEGLKEIAETLSPIKLLAEVLLGEIIKEGPKGEDGKTPEKGKDYLTQEEIDSLVDYIITKVPKGKDGKDAEPVDYNVIKAFVTGEVSKIKIKQVDKDAVVKEIMSIIQIPEPLDMDVVVKTVLSKLPKQKDVIIDYDLLKKYCFEEIRKIQNESNARYRVLNSAGPTTRLHELVDMALEGITVGQSIYWDGTNFVPYTPGTGSSLTVQDIDGNPLVTNVTTIRFSNGTVTDNGDGTVTVVALESAVDNEVVSGSGTSFTLANTPVAGSVHVYALGRRLKLTTDYSISGTGITTVESWSAGDLVADYRK